MKKRFINIFILVSSILLVPIFSVSAAIVVTDDPALDLNSFVVLGVQVAQFILGIVGALTLLMFVYGGFTWITSGGSSDRVKKGKDILVGAVIGLLIVFSSYMIVSYVTNDIFSAKNSKGGQLFTGGAPESNKITTPCKDAGGACVGQTTCNDSIILKVSNAECRQYQVCCAPKIKTCKNTAGQNCRAECQSDEEQVLANNLCATPTDKCCKPSSSSPLPGNN